VRFVPSGTAVPPDHLEPNDSISTATDLLLVEGTESVPNLTIHSNPDGSDNLDYFRFEIADTGTSSHYVEIQFSHAEGDLDTTLYNESGSELDYGLSTTDNETISLEGHAAGVYYLNVRGYLGATASYDLVIVAPSIPSPAEVIVDNLDGGFSQSGTWAESAATDEYNGSSLYSATTISTARWTPNLPTAGSYEVYAWWSAQSSSGFYDRDSAADYTIVHADGVNTVVRDQDVNSGQWNLLGTYNFAAGTGGFVELVRDTNNGVNGTSADAVRFVRVGSAGPQLAALAASLSAPETSNDSSLLEKDGGPSTEVLQVVDGLFDFSETALDLADLLSDDGLFPASSKRHAKRSVIDLAMEDFLVSTTDWQFTEDLAPASV
jgi:hypothetical protein